MKRRVVITGLGTVNPTGNDVQTSWTNIKKGVCGIAPITAFETTDFAVKLAGEVKDFTPETRLNKREARHMARFTQFALYAAGEAIEMSGIGDYIHEHPEEAPSVGVIISSGIGGIDVIESEHNRGLERGFEKVSPFFIPMTISNMAAARVSIEYGFQGMCSCPVTACAGGSNAIGDAFHRIRDGYEDVYVCGGCEASITDLAIGGFASMKALSTSTDPERASIPFDAERNGFVMGEGAGVLVLEEYEHAKNRGAAIIAEITGYAANCDAYHITAPTPSGEVASRCMELAIADASLTPDDIDYINAHGTSTHLNDLGETKAIKAVFGPRAHSLAVSSTKSMTGHLLGGAGALEALFCALALRDGYIPATIGLETPDPECDLDYVPRVGRIANIKHVLSNSLGFGGHNACLVLSKID